jgi:hypothetical protein
MAQTELILAAAIVVTPGVVVLRLGAGQRDSQNEAGD